MNNIFQARIEDIFSMDAEAKKQIPTIQVPRRSVLRSQSRIIFVVRAGAALFLWLEPEPHYFCS
jgi:hypothetical protein